jgi:hypothetical protein
MYAMHIDVVYVVGDTSNWAYDDHQYLNVAIKICDYYSQYWYQNVRQ